MGNDEEPAGLSGLRERLDAGAGSAQALVAASLARADAAAPLNLFTERCDAAAREAARRHDAGEGPAGPLAGIPLVIKDNIDTAGTCSSAGTAALGGASPAQDAPVMARLRAAGAILLGKTNMHELAVGITSNNPHYGACGNPYAPDHIPGGSSGGSAAAVAAGVAAAGLGSDTGGSCRIPAALCGCVGFRPSLGRWPAAGIVPIAASRDTPGPFARSVADCALLDAVCAQDGAAASALTPAPVHRLRLGVPRAFFYEDLDPALEAVVNTALERLAAAGCTLVEVDLAAAAELSTQIGFTLVFYEILRELGYYLARHRPGVSLQQVLEGIRTPGLADLLAAQLGEGAVPATLYLEALAVGRPALQRRYAECFSGHALDALLVPTTPLPARPIGQEETVRLNRRDVPTFQTYIRNTDPPSNAGLPAISLPCGLTAAGLPVGMELVGPAGGDRALLAAAAGLEAVWGALPAPAGP